MKGRWRLAVVLFGVLLALGGLATWDEWQTKREQAEAKDKNKVLDLRPDQVTQIEYFTKGGGDESTGAGSAKAAPPPPLTVSISKKGDVWRLSAPVDAVADTAMISELLKTLTDYTYTKVITDQRSQWADFGLADPGTRITLQTGGEHPQNVTMYLGAKAPVGYNAYLRTSANDRVLMGSQHILISTAKTLNDFRDKTLVALDEAKIKSMSYSRAGEPTIVVERSGGKYLIVQPQKLDADQGAVREIADELNAIRVTGFDDHPTQELQAAFAKPLLAYSWRIEAGQAQTLAFIEHDGKFMAAFDANQRVFVIPDESKAKLRKDLVDFRNRRILAPGTLDAKTVTIDGDVYTSVDGNWYKAADAGKFDPQGKYTGKPGDKPVEQAHIRAFMVDLEFAKTDRFYEPASVEAQSIGKQAPLHKITLAYKDQTQEPVVIELFNADGLPEQAQAAKDKFFVRRTGVPQIFRVARSAFNSMTPTKATSTPVEGQPGQQPGVGPELMDEGAPATAPGDERSGLDVSAQDSPSMGH